MIPKSPPLSQFEIQSKAKAFMAENGLNPPETVIFNRNIKRIPVEGKSQNNKDGSYVGHDNGSCLVLSVWNWPFYGDQTQTTVIGNGKPLSHKQRVQLDRKIENDRRAAVKKQAAGYEKAARGAQLVYKTRVVPATPKHPYLQYKKVGVHDIFRMGNNLLVFGRDEHGKIWNYQRITPDGDKKFQPYGCRSRGTSHLIPGDGKNLTLYSCEGYGTGASIHKATGGSVRVCFDAHNLPVVTEAYLKKRPPKPGETIILVICGDNDEWIYEWVENGKEKHGKTPPEGVNATLVKRVLNPPKDKPWRLNTGRKYALKAAEIAGKVPGVVPVVVFPKFKNPGPDKTDFNDMQKEQGIDGARRWIDMAVKAAVEANKKQSECILRPYSEIEEAYIDWLWPGWLARGKLHILAGPPGHGKTTALMSFASIISNGGTWPDGTQAKQGTVLIWTDEDDPADTLKHRLRECGSDLARVFDVSGVKAEGEEKEFDPSKHIPLLEGAIEKLNNAGHDVQLVILDPVISVVSAESGNTSATRAQLRPVVKLAKKKNTAFYGITHFTKGTTGKDPVERITGSLAFGALTRLATVAMDLPDEGCHPPGAKLFARAKSNIGPNHGGYYYYLDVVEIDGQKGQTTTKVRWGEYVPGNARDLIASAEGEDVSNKMTTVVSWLKNMFSNRKTIPAKEVEEQLKAKGVKPGTWKKAKKHLGIKSKHYANGWVWVWPNDQEPIKSHNSDPLKTSNDIKNIDSSEEKAVIHDDPSIISNKNSVLDDIKNPRVKGHCCLPEEPEGNNDEFVIFHSEE